MTWLIAIPFLMLIIFGETYFFNKKLKKSLNSLNNVINSYKYGEKIEEELPKEFESVLNSFTNLMEQLKVSEAEKINIYNGKYHVLGGLISPLEGIGPDDVNISCLISRIDKENIEEIILALKPSIEGETTMQYIKKILENKNIKITRIATGIPMGTDIDYIDAMTLEFALEGRKDI